MLQPIQFMFLMHIMYIILRPLQQKCMSTLQVSTRGQGQRSININVFTVILTTRFSNTRFADDHFGLCPYFFLFHWQNKMSNIKVYTLCSLFAQMPLAVTHQAMLTVTDHLLCNIYVSCNIVYFHYVSILLYTRKINSNKQTNMPIAAKAWKVT